MEQARSQTLVLHELGGMIASETVIDVHAPRFSEDHRPPPSAVVKIP